MCRDTVNEKAIRVKQTNIIKIKIKTEVKSKKVGQICLFQANNQLTVRKERKYQKGLKEQVYAYHYVHITPQPKRQIYTNHVSWQFIIQSKIPFTSFFLQRNRVNTFPPIRKSSARS